MTPGEAIALLRFEAAVERLGRVVDTTSPENDHWHVEDRLTIGDLRQVNAALAEARRENAELNALVAKARLAASDSIREVAEERRKAVDRLGWAISTGKPNLVLLAGDLSNDISTVLTALAEAQRERDDLNDLVAKGVRAVEIMTATIEVAYCVLCIDPAGDEETHIFSTKERAAAWANLDPRDHIFYDYVIDHPERTTAYNG